MATPERTALPEPDMRALLDAQRAAFVAEGAVTAQARIDRIDRCIELLTAHHDELCAAAAADFGQRPAAITTSMDILPTVLALRHARKHLNGWMRPRRQPLHLPLRLPGTRAELVYQPLGVVGLISPWNFPIGLALGPLAGIFAAGNRCLIKPSELTPEVSALLERLVARYFDPRELAVVTGGPEVAAAFAALPFDHLLFTGSTAVGRKVMAAAAAHLVPVTLELGGKCPAVIGRSAELARAVDRLLIGKLANAGQMCIAPDYAYVPREQVEAFITLAREWTLHAYPGLPANADYTSIVNAGHAARLNALLADAVEKGAQALSLGPAGESGSRDRRLMAPTLLLGVTDEMSVMQEEIFGPLLPVKSYERMEEAIADIQRRERPLALYYFGSDRSEQREVLARTISGGVTVNDVAMHFLAEELPFGGVGASGMGAYHGEHGFQRFSHARAVLYQTRFDLAGLAGLRPPYGARLASSLRWLLRK